MLSEFHINRNIFKNAEFIITVCFQKKPRQNDSTTCSCQCGGCSGGRGGGRGGRGGRGGGRGGGKGGGIAA